MNKTRYSSGFGGFWRVVVSTGIELNNTCSAGVGFGGFSFLRGVKMLL